MYRSPAMRKKSTVESALQGVEIVRTMDFPGETAQHFSHAVTAQSMRWLDGG
jgi:hypothetical protein